MNPQINYQTGAILFRQLAAAKRHGLPHREVLEILGRDPELFGKDRPAIAALLRLIDEGEALSAGLLRLPELVTFETAELIRLAEAKGTEAQTLDAIADDYARQAEGSQALRAALAWPAGLAVILSLLVALMMIFVIPSFKELYSGMGAALPAPTLLVMAISDLLVGWWWLLLLMLAVFVGLCRRGKLPPSLVATAASAVLALPFARGYLVHRFLERLTGWLQVGLDDRALMLSGLRHLASNTHMPPFVACLRQLQERLQSDGPLSAALENLPPLPLRMPLLVQLGEKMGNTLPALQQLAQLAEADLQLSLPRFGRGLFTLLYIVLGIIIAIVVIALYLPIFKMSSLIV